jgi:hypothetical protein
MKKLFLLPTLFFALTLFLHAEHNDSNKSNSEVKQNKSAIKTKKLKKDDNKSISSSDLTKKQVQEQMAREKKYAQEQSFAQGDDYDLKAVEVNQKSLDSIPLIEPDYDFDITDVYRDDI